MAAELRGCIRTEPQEDQKLNV